MLGFTAYEWYFLLFLFSGKVFVGPPAQKSKGYPMHNSELGLHLNCELDSSCLFTHGVHKTYVFSFPHCSKHDVFFFQIFIYIYIYIQFLFTASHGDTRNNNLKHKTQKQTQMIYIKFQFCSTIRLFQKLDIQTHQRSMLFFITLLTFAKSL